MTLNSLMPRTAIGWTFAAVVAGGAGFALAAHWNHSLGALPYLLLLTCPLMYLFMHGAHGGHAGHGQHGTDEKSHAHKSGEASCHGEHRSDEKPQDSKTINS